MNIQALYHQPKSNYCYALNKETLVVRFRTSKNDVKNVKLIFADKYAVGNDPFAAGGLDDNWISEHFSADMRLERSDAYFDYYIHEITAKEINYRLSYIFKIEGAETLYYTEWGPQTVLDPLELHLHYFNFPYLNDIDVHKIPEWVEDAVFYQIFPERFSNGDPTISPNKIESWNTGTPTRENFFGGDIEGIIEKIDYLSELGVNAIYTTPLFEATTNHKYDTIDYMKVDPHFGTNETLKKLVDVCHSKGIKVVLDAVFNHSGYMFDKFQDVVEKGPESKYYDWFYIKEWPIDFDKITYQTFGFEPKMPKLNTSNPEVIDYLLQVSTYWIEYAGIDGWRLDVSNEIDHEFWRKFRTAIKSVSPDAYIVGEIWHNAQPWLLGDQFDGSMNYPFTRACLQYFAWKKSSPQEFADMINTNIVRYSRQANLGMLNILDSHDTPRFLTESGADKSAMKMAALFQMTYEGAPSIYYGSELGMEGGQDPDCRRPMLWNENDWDHDMLSFYKKIIQLRHDNDAFRKGDFIHIPHDDLLIYKKIHENGSALIIMNRTDKIHSIELGLEASKLAGLLDDETVESTDKCFKLDIKAKAMHVFKIMD